MPFSGRWSVWHPSPGTQSGGFWTSLTDQSGGGNDITPVVGSVEVLSGYAPGGTAEVCQIGASDVFRAGKSGGWGAFGTGGAVLVKSPWDASFANESSRFELRTGGFGTGGAVSTLFQLRHTTGDLARLWLNPSFAGPAGGYFGPTWTGIPLAGTADPEHWIQYAIRWTVDGLTVTWRVLIVGERGLGLQIFANQTFTSVLDAALLARLVTAVYMTQPRGGSIGYWYGVMPDADYESETIADGAEVGVDLTDIVTPGVYDDCATCDTVDGFTVILDVAGRSERWDNVRVPLSERVPFFDVAPSARDVSIALTPRVLDFPALALAGHDVGDVLLRVYDGDDLLFAGRSLGTPRWGRAGEPIRLTATESPWVDSTTIPASWTQRVTVIDTAAQSAVQNANRGGIPMSAWGYYEREDLRGDPQSPPLVSALGYDLYVDKAEGRAGPIVFGAPGYQDGESWGATPAYWIDTTEGVEQLQIARHRVSAGTVTIYGPCYDGEIRGKVAAVAHIRTLDGIEVAVAEIGGLLGRGPRMVIEITNAFGETYTVAGNLEFRDYTSTTTVLVPFSLVWIGSASDTNNIVSFYAAMEAAGLVEPWASVDWEIPTPGTIIYTVDIELWRGATGVPNDIIITTETSTTPGFIVTPIPVTNTGVDVVQPTDFRPDVSAEWSVAWTGGEALPGGAGDVIRYVLDQTRIRVDRAHLDSWRRVLNGYTLAGCIDEEVDAAQWLAAQLAWLPIGWTQGRDGLRIWVYDPTAPPVATLDEDVGLDVLGDAGLTEAEPVGQVRIAYRVGEDRAAGRLQTRQQTVWSEIARTGEVVTLETDLCDETATAERAAALRQRAYHARHLVVSGQLERAVWGWLRAGDPVYVRAPSRGVVGRGIVLEIADDGGPMVRVELLKWRDPEMPA